MRVNTTSFGPYAARVPLLVMLLYACGGAPAATPTAEPAPPATSPPQADGDGTAIPTAAAVPVDSDAAVVVSIRGQAYEFEEARDCTLSDDLVDIAAGRDDGLVLLVQGDPAVPAEFLIHFSKVGDFAFAYAPAVPGNDPPRVVSDGDSVEVVAEVYQGGVADGRPEAITVRARCGEAPADQPASPDPADGGGSAGGSATVRIGDETYELFTGDPAVCSLGFGVQASMASADRRASLDLFTAGSAIGTFMFARVLDGELWQPAEDPPPFEVTGASATWSGTLRDRESGREEPATVELECDQ